MVKRGEVQDINYGVCFFFHSPSTQLSAQGSAQGSAQSSSKPCRTTISSAHHASSTTASASHTGSSVTSLSHNPSDVTVPPSSYVSTDTAEVKELQDIFPTLPDMSSEDMALYMDTLKDVNLLSSHAVSSTPSPHTSSSAVTSSIPSTCANTAHHSQLVQYVQPNQHAQPVPPGFIQSQQFLQQNPMPPSGQLKPGRRKKTPTSTISSASATASASTNQPISRIPASVYASEDQMTTYQQYVSILKDPEILKVPSKNKHKKKTQAQWTVEKSVFKKKQRHLPHYSLPSNLNPPMDRSSHKPGTPDLSEDSSSESL